MQFAKCISLRFPSEVINPNYCSDQHSRVTKYNKRRPLVVTANTALITKQLFEIQPVACCSEFERIGQDGNNFEENKTGNVNVNSSVTFRCASAGFC
jgi:hypothetical protein